MDGTLATLLEQLSKQLSAGNLHEAFALVQQVLRLEPDSVDVLGVGASIAMHTGEFEQAESLLRRELALRGNHAPSRNNLGLVLRKLDRHSEAESEFREAIAANPAYSTAYANLGVVLKEQGKTQEAIETYQAGLAVDPGDAMLHYNIAGLLREQGDNRAAIESYRNALRHDPGYVDAYCNLANLYEQENQIESARETADKGLAVDPSNVFLHCVVAKCERRSGQLDEALARLRPFEHAQLPPDLTKECNFELGRVYEKTGDTVASFDHFVRANQAALEEYQSRDIDRSALGSSIDALTAYARLRATQPLGPAVSPAERAEGPVFLVGFPRSGTTLLDQILDTHPDIRTMSERLTVQALKQATANLPGGYPGALVQAGAEAINGIREAYQEEVSSTVGAVGDSLIVDKHPLALIDIPALQRVFPEARFIIALRHPYDVCLSCLMQSFVLNYGTIHFTSLEQTALAYTSVMSAWSTYESTLALHYHPVRYEDLVADPAGTVRELLDYLGKDWSDAVLDYAGKAQRRGGISTPSYHQVSEPIYEHARYRWRRFQAQLAPVLPLLEPYAHQFGYETT
jgi:tetratricopeptide (TPR) repeat protein